MAILLAFVLNEHTNPIQINRDTFMKYAKLNARSTYYTSLRDLQDFGYIRYVPSYNWYLGSLIYLNKI